MKKPVFYFKHLRFDQDELDDLMNSVYFITLLIPGKQHKPRILIKWE